MTVFTLHPRLAADSVPIGDLPLCRVLLMNDSRFPWLILVPRQPDLREVIDLSPADRGRLLEEIASASDALRAAFSPDKLNLGAIGNIVPQLHVHIVARFETDPAWPGVVWGHSPALAYETAAAEERVADLRRRLIKA
ncbi:MAG TPA: HIT family protein [Alphaproteobacteria bacterium]|jgi:diadenosine tetraphosphate (Ap4A) HIT family hydrolase